MNSEKFATEYIKSWLQFKYEREDIPGFVVAIAHKGEVLLNEAYGYANLEKKEKLATNHIFRIASHSKTFTATALMQLQEQGKLRIDDPVVKYLPWLKKHKDKRFKQVTIKQVMSHGAGIIRDGLEQNYWQFYRPYPYKDRFIKDMLEADLVIDNNKKLKYSNYGYTLLGLVIEAASGVSYNTYVTENIIKPLGLKNTGPEFMQAIKDRLVTGYTYPDNKKKRLPITKEIDTKAMSPATGFYATAEDLCHYFNAHIIGSGKLLSDDSKKQMQTAQWRAKNTPEKREYGLGLQIGYIKKTKLYGHGGGFPGIMTKSYFEPNSKYIVTVLTNLMDSPCGAAAKGSMNALLEMEKIGAYKNKFAGRFSCMWGTFDSVPTSKGMAIIYPDSWDPFGYKDELRQVGENTFKITKTGSFNSEGELVKFNFDKNNKVQSVDCAGMTYLPEKEYLESISSKKLIE